MKNLSQKLTILTFFSFGAGTMELANDEEKNQSSRNRKEVMILFFSSSSPSSIFLTLYIKDFKL